MEWNRLECKYCTSAAAPRGLLPLAGHQFGQLTEQRVHGALLRAVAHKELGHLQRSLRREQRTGDLCTEQHKRRTAASSTVFSERIRTGRSLSLASTFMLIEGAVSTRREWLVAQQQVSHTHTSIIFEAKLIAPSDSDSVC